MSVLRHSQYLFCCAIGMLYVWYISFILVMCLIFAFHVHIACTVFVFIYIIYCSCSEIIVCLQITPHVCISAAGLFLWGGVAGPMLNPPLLPGLWTCRRLSVRVSRWSFTDYSIPFFSVPTLVLRWCCAVARMLKSDYWLFTLLALRLCLQLLMFLCLLC